MVYKLSCTLTGHTSDVRAVDSPTPYLVLSASRDTKAIAWTRSEGLGPFVPATPFQAGSRYVNAVAYLEPTPNAPLGYIVAGGQDTLINVFPIGSNQTEPSHTLLGHSENVCALDATRQGTIISGSWDKTARVWKNFNSAYELRGHTQAVWAVVAIDGDHFLTGSADKTIRHWVQHKGMRTFNGHADAVRGLVVIPDIGFASCSNDSEIRVWTLEGDVIHILSGHTSFVYSLALLPNGDIVSSGEDRSVRVWKDGECTQVIVHPAISVWAVSAMPNGDIVSGSSDGVVRVFSETNERWAEAEELKKYDEEVSKQALPSQQIGDVKKSDLPGPEALNAPGTKEGQVLMVKAANGSVEAHQWTSGSWQKIGEVVDAVGSGRKQLYEGKEYDYVFDVDIQEGVPPLKLPYNITDNPYQAALKFLQSNELPESYIDQVVKFIEQNTAGQQLGTGSNAYVDPFTGASRYQATENPAPSRNDPGNSFQDPFTGAGGYHGSPAAAPASASGRSYQDPFTGASGYHHAPSVQPPVITPKQLAPNAIIPVRATLPFKQANVPAMRTKIFRTNDTLARDPSNSVLAFTKEESVILDRVFVALNAASPDPASTTPVKISRQDAFSVLSIAARWPVEDRFPIIDLARLAVAHAPSIVSQPTDVLAFAQTILSASGWTEAPWPTPLPKTLETNILLALRGIANIFQPPVISALGSPETALFEALLKPSYSLFVKPHWVALGTIVLNYSCLIIQGAPTAGVILAVQLIQRITSTANIDSEAQYRALVALGNIVYASKANRSILDDTALGMIPPLLAKVANKEDRFKAVTGEVTQLVSDAKMII